MNDYYVYLYLREDDTPYYVGKGKENRAFEKWGRKTKTPTDKTKIIFYSQNLTEDEAFTIEKELIAQYGRKDNGTGILRNLTDGGDGFSGMVYTDEMRTNLSAAMKEVMNKPEVKAKLSAAMKEALNRPEVKTKLSAIRKEIFNRLDMKNKRSALAKKRFSDPEERSKQSALLKEYRNRPEVKAKHSAAIKEAYRKKREAEQASANTLTKFFSE